MSEDTEQPTKDDEDLITRGYTDLQRMMANGSRPASCSQVLVSYPCSDTRHHSTGWMTCGNCHDKRQMKNHSEGVYQCRKCGQLWKYPSENSVYAQRKPDMTQ